MSTTSTLQGNEGLNSNLSVISSQTEEEFLELQEKITDLHISQHLNQMILSGVIDTYLFRAQCKAESCGIYKHKTKFILNQVQQSSVKFHTYLSRFEGGYLSRLLSSTIPAHRSSYTNTGGVMQRLQRRWVTKNKKKLDELYVVFLRKAEHFGAKFPDFMACLEMVHFAAGMVIEDARYTYKMIMDLAAGKWDVNVPDFTNVKNIENKVEMLQCLHYKYDPNDGFLNTKLTQLGEEFVENVYLASDPEALEATMLAAIMDYTDFYIAYTVQLLQQKKLTEYITRAIREDFNNIDSEPEALFNDCMAELKYLADTLPEYDDIEDLKEIISGINTQVSIPDTPALDKFRQRVIDIRKNGRPNEVKIT